MTLGPLPPGTNLPFERSRPVTSDAEALIVDNVTIAAVAAQTPLGRLPALVFSFSSSAGGELPPVALLVGPAELRKLAELVTACVDAAIETANAAAVVDEAEHIVDEIPVPCSGCGRALHGPLKVRGVCLACQPPAEAGQ